MTGLRTLGSLALVAGVFAGLTGCANHPGDLGAQREDTPTPVVKTVPASAVEETKVAPPVAAATPADNSADNKNAPAELVSLEPGNVASVAPGRPASPVAPKADERAAPAPAPEAAPAPAAPDANVAAAAIPGD